MSRQLFSAIVIVILLLISGMTGCGSPNITKVYPTATITTTPLPATMTAKFIKQVDTEENKWNTLGIASYHIVFKFYEAFVAGLETQRDVIVKNHQVVSSFCVSNNCPAFVYTNVNTVGDLFAVARGSTLPTNLEGNPPDDRLSLGECLQAISFDTTYGFPKHVSIDCPEVFDEENSVDVISFEVIK